MLILIAILTIFCKTIVSHSAREVNGFKCSSDTSNCFLLVQEKKSWSQAIKHCESLNSTLATFETEEKHLDFYKHFWTRYHNDVTVSIWIGGRRENNRWYWIHENDEIEDCVSSLGNEWIHRTLRLDLVKYQPRYMNLFKSKHNDHVEWHNVLNRNDGAYSICQYDNSNEESEKENCIKEETNGFECSPDTLNCYLFVNESKSWDDASNHCKEFNSTLAAFETENKYIDFYRKFITPSIKRFFWIGGERDNGEWRWMKGNNHKGKCFEPSEFWLFREEVMDKKSSKTNYINIRSYYYMNYLMWDNALPSYIEIPSICHIKKCKNV